jgi:hypothetical protein
MPPRLLLLPVIAVAPAAPARAAETCPFMGDQHLAGAMPATKWSLISNRRPVLHLSGRARGHADAHGVSQSDGGPRQAIVRDVAGCMEKCSRCGRRPEPGRTDMGQFSSTLTGASPEIPRASAPAFVTSMHRPFTNGPRSVIVMTTDFPLLLLVTFTFDRNGRDLCAAVSSLSSSGMPDAVFVPGCELSPIV